MFYEEKGAQLQREKEIETKEPPPDASQSALAAVEKAIGGKLGDGMKFR